MKNWKDLNTLLLIDEFDSIQNKEDKHKVAELIKLLSDSNSSFKIFVVGIAESAEELTAGHPSSTKMFERNQIVQDVSKRTG